MIPIRLILVSGVVNHIFDGANGASGNECVYEWGRRHCILPKNYKGNKLNGPSCYRLLALSPLLTSELPEQIKIFGTAMEKLFQVVQDCFGQELCRTYKNSIKEFEEVYRILPHQKDPEKQLTCTIKAHCIFQHVPETIERTGQALGIFSAQSFEASHYDYLETWKRYKVPEDHKDYPKKLKDSTVNYNSYHINDYV